MTKGKITFSIIVATALAVTLLSILAFNFVNAENIYKETYYALRGTRFTVPNFTEATTITNPAGEYVTLSDEGAFRASLEGDYVINYGSDLAVLKVYKTAPAVTIAVEDDLPQVLSEGEVIYFPSATGKSEIKTYDEYVIRVACDSGEAFEITGENKKFTLQSSGAWTIKYVFTDVFGLETEKSFDLSVVPEPVIVLQNFPTTISFGESISTEETYGYFEGSMYECSVKVVDKIGEWSLSDSSFSARVDGENQLVFSAEINGKTVERSVTIDVEYTASSLFVGDDIAVTENVDYPSGANSEKNGLLLQGDSGATATYAKTLDLKKLSDSGAKIIDFQPYGEADSISEIRVTLTDVYDKANTLSVYWWLNPWNDHLSYMLVEYDDVSVAISNESSSLGVVRNTYGAVVYHNFTNVYNKNCVPFNFRYDFDELAVYSAINKKTSDYKVLDADNISELGNWKPFGGFTGTEVYLGVEFTVSSGGGIVISEIGGENLNAVGKNSFVNTGAVQYSGESDFEAGVVGYGFTIPAAIKEDVVFGETDIERRLEYFENGLWRVLSKKDGTLSENEFIPAKSGKYRVVFTGRDNFGNEAVKYFEFSVTESPTDINIQTNAVKNIDVRDDFILPAATVSGGTGEITVAYQVCYNGIYASAEVGDRFTADGNGNILVSIVATDELGFKKATSYTVDVNMNKKFLIAENIPKAMKEGEILTPIVYALDYSEYGKDWFETQAELFVDGVEIGDGGYKIPSGIESVILEARTSDGDLSETFEIAVLPSDPTDISDLLVFDRTSVTSEFFDTGLMFSSKGNITVSAPYPVPFYGLSLKLTLWENSTSEVYVRLTSAKNPDEVVTICISSSGSGKGTLKIAEKTASVSLENGSSANGKYNSATLTFSVDGSVRMGGIEVAEITAYDSGRAFEGFGDGVYVSCGTENSSAKNSIALNYIANQSFNNYTKSDDTTQAIAGFSSELASEYKKGDVFVMPKPCFGDVLSGDVSATLTVRAPDGTEVLSKIQPKEGLEIKLEQYGYYQLVFELVDGNLNKGTKIFRLYVADNVPPVITIGDVKETYSVNQKFVVPWCEVVDDNSSSDDETNLLTVFFYLKNTDDKLTRVYEGEEITLSEKGDYEFIVYAFDSSINISYKIQKFEVR